MTCISGGVLEIFIEPMLAQPQLIVVGHLAVAESLVSLGKDLGFPVTIMGLEVSPQRFPKADRVFDSLDFSQLAIKSNAAIVVASHGNYDEDALTAALQTDAAYVALVSSKARANAVLQYLQDSNLTETQIARLKYPAGLDIGAITPEEIALSILAEIVQLRHHSIQTFQPSNLPTFQRIEAIDPVCGMMVEIATARYLSQHEGETYYFCARGCQRSFEQNPGKYLAKESDRAI
jgi:xanthine dehydrogenase accessory factor